MTFFKSCSFVISFDHPSIYTLSQLCRVYSCLTLEAPKRSHCDSLVLLVPNYVHANSGDLKLYIQEI
ncbi:hypothetical protein BpHYR1_002856 [Brachionus plicatilis]|uniref:Uncharacterized protein n=1 Tax=Brachionus plicatilis TaxID=10195 RepID=A0A3M7QY17_BRAPC|nr:hypothetical protein BpHYR1_002856 [Brachionus plicatilis]